MHVGACVCVCVCVCVYDCMYVIVFKNLLHHLGNKLSTKGKLKVFHTAIIHVCFDMGVGTG